MSAFRLQLGVKVSSRPQSSISDVILFMRNIRALLSLLVFEDLLDVADFALYLSA